MGTIKKPRLIQNRCGTYSVVVWTEHGRRRVSTRTKDKEEAKRVVKQAKLEQLTTTARAVRLSQTVVSQILNGRNVKLVAACIEWVSWMKSVGRSIRTVTTGKDTVLQWSKDQWLDGQFPSAIREQQISNWINRKTWKAKYSTRQLSLCKITSFLEFCAAKGYVNGNPAKLVEVDRSLLTHLQKEPKIKRVLTGEEMDRLMAFAKEERDTFWVAAIALGRWAGLRISDICLLQWESILDSTKVVVWTMKTDARVEIVAPTELREVINFLFTECHNKSDYVWPDDAKMIMDPSVRATRSNQFRAMCRQLEIKDASFHCLRHTFATEMRMRGIPIPHISKSMGHSSPFTTEGYIHEKGVL